MPDTGLSAFPDEPVATKAPGQVTPPTAAPPAIGLSAFPAAVDDRLTDTVNRAATTPADSAARIFDLQVKTGLPADVISRNLDEVTKAANSEGFDAVAFRKSSPLLAKWLEQHPLNASVAQDDLVPLTFTEHALRLTANSVRAAAGGLMGGLNMGAWGVLQAAGDVLGLPGVSAWAKAASDDAAAMAAGIKGDPTLRELAGQAPTVGPNERAFLSGFESIGSSAPILAAGLLGMPEAAVLSLMGTQTGGQAYTQAKAAGVSTPAALAFGTSQGAIEAATEMLPIHALFGDLAQKSGLLKTLAHQAILEVPGEQLATALQDLNEWAVLHPDQPFSTYLQERPSAAVQTLIATLVATGAQTGAVHTLNKVVNGLAPQRFTEALGQGVTESQLAQRSPAKFQEFLESATKDTPIENLYANPETWATYWQEKGVDPAEMAEQAGSSKEAYQDALQAGHDLKIPTAGYATALAGTEHNTFWSRELKLDPGEMNTREAEEFVAAHSDALTAAALAPAGEGSAASQAIHDQLVQRLVQHAGFTQQDAETNAAVVSSMLTNFIERRAGLDPRTIFEARTDPRFVERVQGPEAIGTGQPAGTAGPGDEPLYQDDVEALLRNPAAVAALERRQEANPQPPATGERRNAAVIAELEQETQGAAVGAGGGQQTLRALRNDPTLAARARAMQIAAQETPRIRAEFLAHGPDGPLFNIVGGPKHGSTVGAQGVRDLGLQVPDVPADTGERLNGDQLRARMIAARAKPNETLFQPLAQNQQIIPGPMFFSRIVKAVEESKLGRAPGSQWVATILNYKGGIAKGEAEFRKVEELAPTADIPAVSTRQMVLDGFAELQTDKVYTKQEILDYLAQNALKPEIVELEGDAVDEDEVERELEARRDSAIEAEVESLQENYDKDEEIDRLRENFQNSRDYPDTDVKEVTLDEGTDDERTVYHAYYDGEVVVEYNQHTRQNEPEEFDTEDDARERLIELTDQAESDYIDENYREPDFYDQARDYVNDTFDEDQERQDILDNGDLAGGDGGTHYGEYVEKGPAENYREVFVTFPDLPPQPVEDDGARIQQLEPNAEIGILEAAGGGRADSGGGYFITVNGEVWKDHAGEPIELWSPTGRDQALADAKEQYQTALENRKAMAAERAARTQTPRWNDGHDLYKEVENPVTRIRVNERQTEIGRVLFIEEVQPPHDDEQRKIPPLLIRNWRELGFKWALRDAAERGLAAVAWTTGKQQADRYSLRRMVQKITWEANEEGAPGQLRNTVPGALTVTIVPKDYSIISLQVREGVVVEATDTRLRAKKLSEVVGEEVAARMTGNSGQLEEEGLEIGGKGLQKLYDRDFVNVVNGLAAVKKAKGRVEEIQVQTVDDYGRGRKAQYEPAQGIRQDGEFENGAPLWRLILSDGSVWGTYASEEHAQTALKEWNEKNAKDSRFTAQKAIRMTPELTAAVLGGQPLFQEGTGTEKRGAISFNPKTGQGLISLFAKADLSTFQHETAHLFLELVGDTVDTLKAMDPASLTDNQRGVIEDYDQVVLPFLGVSNRGEIGTAQHERFASAWEDYLSKGEAPSAALRPVFARIKAWLAGVYRNVRRQIVLTPEVRGFMDRLLASDDAIRAATADANFVPLFTDAASAGLTPEQFALYRKTLELAHTTATEALDAQIAADVARQQAAAWRAQKAKTREAVEAELATDPVYRAMSAMRDGTEPSGQPLPGETTEPLKLNRQAVVDLIGEAATKQLPRPVIYTREGGLHPNAVAEMFGFTSGQEMLERIGQSTPFDTAAARETDKRMLLEHGGILTDGTMHEKAQQAVANDYRDRVVRAEIKALQNLARTVKPHVRLAEAAKNSEIRALAGQVKSLQDTARKGPGVISRAVPSANVIRETAQRRIAGSPIRTIEPRLYWAAARQSNTLALAAAAKQDFPTAIYHQTQQLLNLALFRESARVLENVDQRVRFAKALDKPAARKRIGRAGATYQDQIDGILDRYEFATVSEKTLERRASMRKWAAGMEGEGFEVALSDEQLDDARRVNYRELTYDELVGVTDTLKQIEHLAALKFRLLQKQDQREFVQVRDTVVDSLRANNTTTKLPLEFQPTDETKRSFGLAFASHRKVAMLARALDGHVDGGAMWEHFIRPINAASDAKQQRSTQEGTAYLKILEQHYPGRQLAQLHEKTFIPEIGESLSHEAAIAVGLNWGTQEGRDRLLNDPTRRWSQGQAEAVLDTLTPNDWAFIRATWEFNERFWPEIRDQQERVTGVPPDKVQGIPVQTKNAGTFTGGYYHLAYDGRLSPRAQQNEAATMAKLGGAAAYVRTTTRQGHVEARQSNVRLSVKLDLGVQFNHIEEVIHSLTHREMLIDVTRLLRDSQVQRALFETAGDQTYRQFTSLLEDIAKGNAPATNWMDKAANFMRTGTQIAGLGWNLWTAAQQPLGIFNGMSRVGPSWVMRGMGRWLRDASTMESTTKWIANVSPFMAERVNTATQDLSDLRAKLREPGGWFDTLVRTVSADTLTQQSILDGYLWHIGLMQRVADVPTWLGAYEKAMANHENDEARAIALADQAVIDSQGSGSIKDLASIQRGTPIAKLWLTFYSYGSTVLNSTIDVAGATNFKSPASVATLLGHLSLLYLAPALGTVAMAHAFGRMGGDDEDWTAWLAQVGREMASSALNGIVLVRELNGLFAEGTRGYEGPAGARFLQLVYDLGGQVKQGVVDEGLFKAINSVAGVLFRYPAGQVQKTVDGFAALQEGRSSNPIVLLTGPPPKKAGQ